VRADGRGALGLVVAAIMVTSRVHAAGVDAAPAERATRDVATLTSREAVLTEQAEAAGASARWRARALYRVVVVEAITPDDRARAIAPDDRARAIAPDDRARVIAPDDRARAIDVGTRALARDLAEARALRAERDQLRAERDALAASARADEQIGAAPAFAPPVAGAVLARFGVASDRTTGVLVGHAGVRLASSAGATVHAPAAGMVVRVASAPAGTTLVLDDGAGWTTIVGGLADPAVALGDRVAAGQRLGTSASSAVAFEVWRGRRAVDPLLLVRSTSPASAALAAPARLP
jgi:murein DD-endopeptidase MepM/ murein hydrolase activator NlpD